MTNARTNLLVCSFLSLLSLATSLPVSSAGFVMPAVPAAKVQPGPVAVAKKKPQAAKRRVVRQAAQSRKKQKRTAVVAKKKAPAVPARPPQDELSNMSKLTVANGVTYRRHRGRYNINILEVDLKVADVELKPVLAGESFNRLDEVKDQAEKVKAIAAVNANYFKKDGTPLGTLIIDGEWVAGPLYDRVAMGITADNQIYIDNPKLHGIIETSNPKVGSLWVNNVNQPRRHGSRLILYTRRWGSQVKIPYAGTLVAVDASGRVLDKSLQVMTVPYGGYVLSDTKSGAIGHLSRGDYLNLQWSPSPARWKNVEHAVSGGPTLIRNGKLFVNLKDERFKKNWTSSSIHARTAAGVTRDRRLVLLTVEGPHTLWDVAKLLHKMGCVEAMNLDGGGSTTMVVNGNTVTRNKDTFQRRVATSLAVLPKRRDSEAASQFVPAANITELPGEDVYRKVSEETPKLGDPVADAADPEHAVEQPVEKALSPDVVQAPPAQEVAETAKKQRKKGKKSLFKWFGRE